MKALVISKINFLKNEELSNLTLFSAASCISLFGTSIYNLAISLYVLKITGSSLSFATTQTLSIISTILVSPFAGVLADKIDKKVLSIIGDSINGLIMICLYLLTLKYPLNISMIYISTFCLNVFSTVYGITTEAAKPNLVSKKYLMSINSISKVIESSSSIAGPMIGGIVYAFLDVKLFILINGLSFLLSALLELFINFKFNYNAEEKESLKFNILKDTFDGFTYLKSRKNIINLLGVLVALNFFMGLSITVPMPYIINNILVLNTNFFGIIEAAFPIGMILGAIIIKKAISKYSYQQIIVSTNLLLAFCMISIGVSVILHYKISNEIFYLIYFLIVMILAGTAVSCIDIPLFYILQQTVSDEFRGRVLSLGISVAKIILPVALIIAGVLMNAIPSFILPILSGILLSIFSLFFIKINY
ncbi:MFS transporter [Inconstantimicrobium mannanitabidum]|nr:MFS transporter [Clostridium sp. TW13]